MDVEQYCELEYDYDIITVGGLFSIINGIVVGGICWCNRTWIYNKCCGALYNIVDRTIYAKSWLEVKYNVYISPLVKRVSNMIAWDDLLFIERHKRILPVRIELIFKDDTRVILERESVVNEDLFTYNVDEVDVVFVYKYDEDVNGWECAIYNDPLEFVDLLRGIRSFPVKSSLSFMSVCINIWNTSFEINISSPDNYIMVGNQVFDERFIRYMMERQHGENVMPGRNYSVDVMDSNVNEVCMGANQYMIVKTDEYDIINVKTNGEYNSPSEESS
jgi:hypothetical protein